MSLRHAVDMPEARSRLLRYLSSGSADEDWTFAAMGSSLAVPPDVPLEPKEGMVGRLTDFTVDLIGSADLWWIHSDLTELAVAAGESLPTFRCHPGMLPSPVGLMVWADPIHTMTTSRTGTDYRARGVAWKADDFGVWLIGYDDTPDLPSPDGREHLSSRLGWLAESESIYIPWRDELQFQLSERPGDHEIHNAAWTQCAVATWLLIGQTLATQQPADLPRPTDRRRIARRGHPTAAARIVSLTHRPSGSHPAGSDREYRSRWLLSGHWRQQPWGPGRKLRRPVWIDPYLKGPEDAPLLHSERVRTARL